MHIIVSFFVAIFLLVYFKSVSDFSLKGFLKRVIWGFALLLVLLPFLIWGAFSLLPFLFWGGVIFLAFRWMLSPSKPDEPESTGSEASLPPTASPSSSPRSSLSEESEARSSPHAASSRRSCCRRARSGFASPYRPVR